MAYHDIFSVESNLYTKLRVKQQHPDDPLEKDNFENIMCFMNISSYFFGFLCVHVFLVNKKNSLNNHKSKKLRTFHSISLETSKN